MGGKSEGGSLSPRTRNHPTILARSNFEALSVTLGEPYPGRDTHVTVIPVRPIREARTSPRPRSKLKSLEAKWSCPDSNQAQPSDPGESDRVVQVTWTATSGTPAGGATGFRVRFGSQTTAMSKRSAQNPVKMPSTTHCETGPRRVSSEPPMTKVTHIMPPNIPGVSDFRSGHNCFGFITQTRWPATSMESNSTPHLSKSTPQ